MYPPSASGAPVCGIDGKQPELVVVEFAGELIWMLIPGSGPVIVKVPVNPNPLLVCDPVIEGA